MNETPLCFGGVADILRYHEIGVDAPNMLVTNKYSISKVFFLRV